MDTNSRIIRDERDEAPVFEESSRATPRIDLVLGVALAVVAGAIGVLSSLGLGAPPRPGKLMRPDAQVALADTAEADFFEPASLDPAPLAMTPIVVASPAPNDIADWRFVFEEAEAPALVRATGDKATRERIERALACLDEVRRNAEEDGAIDRRSVIRFLGAATSAALDDSEFDATIDDVTVTIESLIESMEAVETGEPVWIAPRRDAQRRVLRAPMRTLGV
ncbi:MAG: hypothetical protein ACF8QF_01710 [Phycisphaerales bacterium]